MEEEKEALCRWARACNLAMCEQPAPLTNTPLPPSLLCLLTCLDCREVEGHEGATGKRRRGDSTPVPSGGGAGGAPVEAVKGGGGGGDDLRSLLAREGRGPAKEGGGRRERDGAEGADAAGGGGGGAGGRPARPGMDGPLPSAGGGGGRRRGGK
jgi:hypothetical protein